MFEMPNKGTINVFMREREKKNDRRTMTKFQSNDKITRIFKIIIMKTFKVHKDIYFGKFCLLYQARLSKGPSISRAKHNFLFQCSLSF